MLIPFIQHIVHGEAENVHVHFESSPAPLPEPETYGPRLIALLVSAVSFHVEVKTDLSAAVMWTEQNGEELVREELPATANNDEINVALKRLIDRSIA